MRFGRPALATLAVGTVAIALAASPGSPAGRTAPAARPAHPQLRDLPFEPRLAAYACPVERGPVKEGSDADRWKVSTTVTYTSMKVLVGKAKPSSYPTNSRIRPVELHTYQLNDVILRQYKIESDGDIHLVLRDGHGHQMIAEIPYSPCVPKASRWTSAIRSARAGFTSVLPVSTGWHDVRRRMNIRGLGFFDVYHGQTGAAGNGIELHPVIRVHFR